MSYDEPSPPVRCACGHWQDKHERITNTGIIAGGVSTSWFGRCKAKKCPCWRFKVIPPHVPHFVQDYDASKEP